jgi:hypothetical protein
MKVMIDGYESFKANNIAGLMRIADGVVLQLIAPVRNNTTRALCVTIIFRSQHINTIIRRICRAMTGDTFNTNSEVKITHKLDVNVMGLTEDNFKFTQI